MSAPSSVLDAYELVVGMEVHAQLNTESKLFCGCKVEPSAEANTRTCPVCLGQPGTLPVLNQAAFRKALTLAVALEADLEAATELDRKNYYYPDLPKNYQISQIYHNIGPGGTIELLRSGQRVRMHNVHLEEDAGKLIHEGGDGKTSTVDLNRAGTPLAEIVTHPDFRSVDEVDDYMETLTQLLRVLDISHARMNEGNLRFEASISVRRHGEEELGARVEIKNLNSYSAVRRAIDYERARQVALLEAGLTPRQETRLWSEDWDPKRASAEAYEQDVPPECRASLEAVVALLPPGKDGWRGRTGFMRSKEDTQDYRYFPEPDLPPVALADEEVAAIRAALPELPGARRRRLADELKLSQKAAEVLARDYDLADYFEAVVAAGAAPKEAINLVLNQVAALLNEKNLGAAECPVPAAWVAELIGLMGELPKDLVLKKVWPKVLEEELSPREVVAKHKIEAVSADAIREATDAAWAANPKAVADILAGNKKAAGAIVGAVMKATKGQAGPRDVNARIQELIKEAQAD